MDKLKQGRKEGREGEKVKHYPPQFGEARQLAITSFAHFRGKGKMVPMMECAPHSPSRLNTPVRESMH